MSVKLHTNKLVQLSAILGSLLLAGIPGIALSEKLIVGRVEKVTLNSTDFVIHAKIDTGAKHSSLNATEYKLSRKNGEKWIRFNVTNKDGETITLNKRFERFAKIKRKGAEVQQRPVIEIEICLGRVKKQVEVNLVNRSNFNYQMLIGRSFLHNDIVVDVDQIFATNPECE